MKLVSTAIPSSEGFTANRAAHLEALETVRAAAELAAEGGGARSRERRLHTYGSERLATQLTAENSTPSPTPEDLERV